MCIFSKTLGKTNGNNLNLLVILIIAFLFTLNISFIHVEGAIASDKTSAKTIKRAGCAGSGCPPHCLPISLGLSVDVMEVFSSERAKFCIDFRARGYDMGTGWFTSTVRAGGYPGQSICECTWDGFAFACVECSEKCTKTLTAPGGTILFWTYTVQRNPQGIGVCWCTTDPITVLIEPPSTSEELPTPEELGPPPPESQVGDPINVMNGNMYLEERDALIQTGYGLPFHFSRSYNSFGDSYGPLGHNWKHSFEYSIEVDTATGDVTLKEPTGREITFVRFEWESTIEYTPPYGIHYRLEHDTLTEAYTVIKEDGTKYHFRTVPFPFLYKIVDRNGNWIALHGPHGLLNYIVHWEDGHSFTLDYYADGSLRSVLDNEGRVLVTYEYYPDDNLRKVIYPDGSWVMYTYGERGLQEHRITQISNSDNLNRYFEYDSLGRATATYGEDENERVDVSYKTVCTTCPRSLHAWAVSSDTTDTTTYVSGWGPDRTRRFLTEVTNPRCSGCGVEYKYDGGGNICKITYENGVEDTFAYDIRGNMTSQIKAHNTPIAQETRYVYHDDFNLPTYKYTQSIVKPSSWDITYYEYDDNGNMVKKIESGWIDTLTEYRDTTIYEYNLYGQLTKIDGPRSDVDDTTSFVYEANGDLKYIIQANGDTTEYGERDYLGNLTWIKDPNGVLARYFYDQRGRLAKVVNHAGDPDSTVIEYTYNFSGNITETVLPRGNSINYGYDSNNWLRNIVNSVNDSLIYYYDNWRNRIREEIKDSLGNITKFEDYEYNNKDLLTKIINPDSTYTEFEYDEMGNRISRRDANGNYTYYEYDELNRLTRTIQMLDSDSLITQFFYDAHDNLIQVTDADSNGFTYKYSDRDNLIEDSSSITGVTRYSYDQAGNLVSKINSEGDTITYEYDELNRLTRINFPDSTQNISYVYDGTTYDYGIGRLFQEQTPACTTTYQYDAFGRLYQEFRKIDGVLYSTTYEYDKNGNIEKMLYPSGLELQHSYDLADRVNKVSWNKGGHWRALADSVRYAPYGGPTSYSYGNGITTHFTYDYRYLIDTLYAGNDPILNKTYTYDPVGNITQIYDNLDTAKSRVFAYDDLSRLISATSSSFPSGTIGYTCSGNGNRLTKSFGSDTTFYTYSENKLVSSSGFETAVYRYDNLGNCIFDSTAEYEHTFEYDQNNRLISVNSGDLGRYYYDGEAKRIKKVYENTKRVYLYDQFGNLICEMDTVGRWKADYVYLNGKPLAKIVSAVLVPDQPIKGPGSVPDDRYKFYHMSGLNSFLRIPVLHYKNPQKSPSWTQVSSSQHGRLASVPIAKYVCYYHVDHLGTPLVMTGKGKRILWRAEYYPFGEIFDEFTVVSNEFRFPGQYHDRETELHHNWYRYYDPRLGRYISEDPLRGTVQFYAYCGNHPVGFIDPLGLQTLDNICYQTCAADEILEAVLGVATFGISSLVFDIHLFQYSVCKEKKMIEFRNDVWDVAKDAYRNLAGLWVRNQKEYLEQLSKSKPKDWSSLARKHAAKTQLPAWKIIGKVKKGLGIIGTAYSYYKGMSDCYYKCLTYP